MSRPGERSHQAAGRPLVVVVDDDSRLRQSLKDLLSSAGIEAGVFSSGVEALESTALGEAACLITDIRMPEMGGWELQRRGAVKYPALPLIFITAHQDDTTLRRARSSGAFALLYKPFDGEELLRVVEHAMRLDQTPGQWPDNFAEENR
jgi:FixJ family two-component response regulator